jgi:hypothetical protein
VSDYDDTSEPPAKAPYTPWFKGMPRSPNPAGRGKGVRNKISQRLVEDFSRHWASHGYSAIEKVYEDNPGLYLKIATSLVPRELLLQIARPMEQLSDIELQQAAAVEHEAGQKLLAHIQTTGGAELIEKARREVFGEAEDDE